MTSLLLVVIYLAFISLGLPDSLLGSVWPLMHESLNVSVSLAGVISMIIAGGTIVSSLFSSKLIHKLGTAKVTIISVGLTAIALMGFSISSSFVQLCLWSIPYGLGAGSVDAALNNYVALHYKSKHMSWLHCFWGIGATTGPYIMGLCLSGGLTWNAGYRTIGIIQIVLVVILGLSLPLWKKEQSVDQADETRPKALSVKEALQLPGAKAILLSFFCYCAVETTTGLWASSYLTLARNVDAVSAASWASLFYFGITVGRLICGFITDRLGDRKMVRCGQIVAVSGIVLVLLPLDSVFALVGLVMIGMGCAPIYPSLIHETPENFGKEQSQSLMGLQMACAYVGSTFVPPIFGWLSGIVGLWIFPLYLLCFVVLMIFMSEKVNRTHAQVNH